MTYSVHKFGGSSLRHHEGLADCIEVLEQYSADSTAIAVVSALFGVTNLLELAAHQARDGESFDLALEQIADTHDSVVQAIESSYPGSTVTLSEQLSNHLSHIRSRLSGIGLLGEIPEKVSAEILGSGEHMSSMLFETALTARGQECRRLDHSQSLVADGPVLDALVDIDASKSRLDDALQGCPSIIVIPGFVAATPNAELVTLGRNGSDYSAACVAAALAADSCIIWKDVDGIFTANPALVRDARLLPQVSYNEAMELSYFGAKVINAKAIGPLMSYEIRCEIRNVHNRDQPGTVVSKVTDTTIKGISHLDGIALINIAGPGMRGRVGSAQRVFNAMARKNISAILIVQSSSEYAISLAVREEHSDAAVAALNEEFHFERLHQLITQVSARTGRAIISLVGDGLYHKKGVAARLLTAVSAAGVNVEAIAQGPSERAIALSVESNEAALAIKACHDVFFSAEQHLDVILLGCGAVGAVLLQQFHTQQENLAGHEIRIRVRGLANSSKLLLAEHAIDLENWRDELEQHGRDYNWDDILAIKSDLGLINPTIIDCTASPEVARQYADFIDEGFNVVAANKHANTLDQEYYERLRELCKQRFCKFLYETNVGAGLPVMDNIQGLMHSGDSLQEFNGILSGSLSLIFGLLDDGMSFSEAVASAREKGFTEPDPREDLSGNDVARKLLIIAREFGLKMELADVEVESVLPADFPEGLAVDELADAFAELDKAFAERISAAAADDKVLRYAARIRDGKCSVGIQEVGPKHPLYNIRDGENALALLTRYYQPIPIVLRGYGAGNEVTAAGVFGDVLRTLWRPVDQ